MRRCLTDSTHASRDSVFQASGHRWQPCVSEFSTSLPELVVNMLTSRVKNLVPKPRRGEDDKKQPCNQATRFPPAQQAGKVLSAFAIVLKMHLA